ncbi:MAG: proline dehydrogenase family protein, partial [Gemmatimonadota bacterium]
MNPLRPLLLRASRSRFLRRRVPRYRFVRRAVRRFMPGEDAASALEAAESLAEHGITSVFTRLGENVTAAEEARAVADHYVELVARIADRGLDGNLSVKPTQLGLDVGGRGRGLELATEHLARIVEAAHEVGAQVAIDMESSPYVDSTLELYRRVRARRANVGVCLQAYLHRTMDDLVRLLPLPPAIRLVKGAYAEPRDVAIASRRGVDASFVRLGEVLLGDLARGSSARVAFATHDIRLLERLAD